MKYSFGGWIRRLAAASAVVAAASLALAGGALADAPSNPGTFVIGDQNVQVGSQVTFWGAQWWKDNPLSTGDAPASFKGFADNATATCGSPMSGERGTCARPRSTRSTARRARGRRKSSAPCPAA